MKTLFVKLSLLLLSLSLVLSIVCLPILAENSAAAETENAIETETSSESVQETDSDSQTEPIDLPETTDATEIETTSVVDRSWQCSSCMNINTGGKYCTHCGEEAQTVAIWECAHQDEEGNICGAGNTGNYCNQCRTPRPEGSDGVDINVHPSAFVDNLKYMAAGMAGIFIVIGAIALSIVLLSKLTDRKKNDQD